MYEYPVEIITINFIIFYILLDMLIGVNAVFESIIRNYDRGNIVNRRTWPQSREAFRMSDFGQQTMESRYSSLYTARRSMPASFFVLPF